LYLTRTVKAARVGYEPEQVPRKNGRTRVRGARDELPLAPLTLEHALDGLSDRPPTFLQFRHHTLHHSITTESEGNLDALEVNSI
jgi:hypothetical protein